MVRAESLFRPGIWIPAIAAPAHISLKPNFVALVVALLEAVLAYNAGRIFFAGLTLPGHVSGF